MKNKTADPKFKEITDQIWSQNAEVFMRVRHTSQERILHPYLAEQIKRLRPKDILDFGCGDTRIVSLLPKEIIVDVYDKNPEMISIARVKNQSRIRAFLLNNDEIPESSYDAALLSMVLMTIQNPEEHQQVLRSLHKSLRIGGDAIIAVSHPCFRDRIFSNVTTSFKDRKTFQYLKEAEPFTVRIEDESPPAVTFVDYHWTLSFTISEILKAGFKITHFQELGDDPKASGFNPDVPLFIVITAKKEIE